MNDTPLVRTELLRERVKVQESTPGRTTFAVPFRQKQLDLVKIQVPINFPYYNTRSGRTHTHQTKYIANHGLSEGFFADPEADDVQAAQHQLLLDILAADEKTNLEEDLKRRDQLNPLILTKDGFVVDGNRRLAALRDHGEAEHVDAVVLPEDATAKEAFETEIELQMARDTRLGYEWVNEALHIRYGIDQLEEEVKDVARRMNKDEKEVNESIRVLALVDQYLDWAGSPGAYHLVPGDSRQGFQELLQQENPKQRKRLAPDVREALRFTCFGVIQDEAGGYEDIRKVSAAIGTEAGELLARARDQLPKDIIALVDSEPADTASTAKPEAEAPAAADEDLFGSIAAAEGEPAVTPGTEIARAVQNSELAKRSTPVIVAIARDLDAERRESKEKRADLDRVRRAHKSLELIQLTKTTPHLDVIEKELDALGDLAQALSDQAKKLGAS